MKKTVLVFSACLLPVWVGAQSTCETRVDAHPNASTMQRVDYCLNGAYENMYNNPGLVFSGVTTRQPATQQQPPQPASAHDGHFKQEQMKVNQTFVETRQFPKLSNERESQQEIWARRRAAYQGQQEGKTTAEKAACEPQEEKKLQSAVQETKAGLRARTKKPGRRFVQIAEVEETVVEVTESAPQEVAPAAEEYTYDSAVAQSYVPATPQAQVYAPATPDAQEYIPAEPAAQPYAPAGQEEIPVGTSSYAPAN